jgi:hypothetical protein
LINTTKIYKKNFDKKEAWPNYVAFLEGAYKFSQAKIVLGKRSSLDTGYWILDTRYWKLATGNW